MMRVSSRARGSGRRRISGVPGIALACAVTTFALIGGCSGSVGSGTYEDAVSLFADESDADPTLDDSVPTDVVPDLHDLDRQELLRGQAVMRLGVSRLLSQIGVFGLLESYLADIPAGAYFLTNFEVRAAMSASEQSHDAVSQDASVLRDFERRMFIVADNELAGWRHEQQWPIDEPDALHDAFYEVFEQCGRDSPWPDVKMSERVGYAAGDVLYLDPELSISQYEYRELLHVCGRYAATYPTLDPEVRDELLAPQRAYFARGILDRLDIELPLVEVPPEYQDEVDELRANGW